MRKWVAATAVLVLLAAFSAGMVPWLDAIAGAFKPPDFAQDIAAARILADRGDQYTTNFAAIHAQVLGAAPGEGYPYLPHPPFTILLTWPFSRLTFSAAALWWFAASLACSFVLAIVLGGFAFSDRDFRLPRLPEALLFFGALLVWPPVLYNLERDSSRFSSRRSLRWRGSGFPGAIVASRASTSASRQH